MKNAQLGDYLLWNGKPAKVIGETDRRMVIIELLENCRTRSFYSIFNV